MIQPSHFLYTESPLVIRFSLQLGQSWCSKINLLNSPVLCLRIITFTDWGRRSMHSGWGTTSLKRSTPQTQEIRSIRKPRFKPLLILGPASDPLFRNLYGSHPFYLETRYYEIDENGNLSPVTTNETNVTADYVSYSHGVYNRNART